MNRSTWQLFRESEIRITVEKPLVEGKGDFLMKISYIVAESAGNATLQSMEYDPASLAPDQVLLENEYSVISAGTERAWISGQANNPQQSFPFYPGYSASGRVMLAGSRVTSLKPGDRVLITAGGHRSHTVKTADSVFKITNDSIDLREAAFAYIASFSMLGVRNLRIEPGESVMIAGLGILGMIALQFAALSGAVPLMVADYDAARLALAMELGADAAFHPGDADFAEQIKAFTDGAGVNAVVEVTGVAAALKQALQYTAKRGRISLLGCTRVPDAPVDFYREVHLPGITLIGAHTSNHAEGGSRPERWTANDDYRTFLRFLANGKMKMRPLISEMVSPANAHEVYTRLIAGKNPPLGMVFDWKLIR